MQGNMVINRSDAKKRKKEGEMLDNSLPESPKRTKVHAQRKFAQGSNLSSPTMTPVKDKDKSKTNGSVSSSELIPSKRPKTEDFLTFLCLRGTPILPPRLDFFNLASVPDGQEEEQVQALPEGNKESMRNKTVPLHSNSKLTNVSVPTPKSSPKLPVKVTEKKTDPCDLSSSGISRKSEKTESKESIVRTGNAVNKRSTTAVQALKKKYQEQRLAKQRGNTLSKLVQIVKEKSMMRTRSSTSTESIHLTGKSQPVVKLEKLSKSKILRKTSVKSVVSPKKEQSTKKEETSPRSASSLQRVTRSIVLSKEIHTKTSTSGDSNITKAIDKVNSGQTKRNSLRSRGSLQLTEEESVSTRRNVARLTPNEKQNVRPSKELNKSQTEISLEKKQSKSKSPMKGTGKEFASSLSDFSSDDDQPLVKKSSKISIQNVRRTKMVKKALKRIAMKNRKPSRMMTRSQQHHPMAAASRIPHRPTRKTKEAATVFMELIGKKWTSPEEDNADDDLVSLVNFPDVRKLNKQGKGENESKPRSLNETSKRELNSSKEKSKSATKTDAVVKRVSDTKEKVKEIVKSDKEKKNPKDRPDSKKIIAMKQNKPAMSQKERILREKMRRKAGKVICNKTAHSKCFASKVVERKAGTSKEKVVIHQVQTRNRSLRSDSSDEVGKKLVIDEKEVILIESESKMTSSYRMTRRSFRGFEEPHSVSSKAATESKEEPKSKSGDISDSSPRMSRPLRKAATKSITFHPRSSSSQSEEKFSDSDEEPLGRKVIKSLRQSVNANKSMQEKKEGKLEIDEKPRETVKKTEEKVKDAVKKVDEKPKEGAKKTDEKSKDAVKKGDDKPKEVNKKVDDKLKKGDDKSKEATKKSDDKPKETTKKSDDKPKEATKKSDDKPKEATKKSDDKPKEATKKGDDKPKEVTKKGDDKPKEATKKGDDKVKDVVKKSDEKIKEVSRKSDNKSKDSAKKGDDKPKEMSRRTSINSRNAEEEPESELSERSTRARSLKITATNPESSKIAKSSASDGSGEKFPKVTGSEVLKESDVSPSVSQKRIHSSPSLVSDDVTRRITRNDKPSKINEQIGKVEDKTAKKKVGGDGGSESVKKIVGSTRGKTRDSLSSALQKEDPEHPITKSDAKRPIDSALADGNHPNETGQSDSKKLKGNVSVDSSKVTSQQANKLSEEYNCGKTQPRLSFTEKFVSMGSKVDEALKSMKKDAVCPLISDNETPVELIKVESSMRKKSSNGSVMPKKEQTKQATSKKTVGSAELAARYREPVEVRCDKMCEKSKLFSIEKQAHGGLVLVKKIVSGEHSEDSSPSIKASESQTSASLGISLRKYDVPASVSNTSITVPNVPLSGRHTCSCKPWISVSDKPSSSNILPCSLHSEVSSTDHAGACKDQKIKDIESPSKDSRKSSEEVANAESLHNTSAFGTDVDSFNDIECGDSEVRRKVSKTVEEIEKWLLVSDIINSGKIPEDKDKPEESELQANKIEFDNIRASMLDSKNLKVVESDDNIKEKKPTLSKHVNKTLESVEKGIGIPLETFYNRVSQKSKVSDSFSLQSQKAKEEKGTGMMNALQSSSKQVQACESQPQKGGKTCVPKNRTDATRLMEGSSKIEEKVPKPEPKAAPVSKEVVLPVVPSTSKGKAEAKRSPVKDKSVGTSGVVKKTSCLRNFRMKNEGRMKVLKVEKSSVKSSPSAGGTSAKCSQMPIKSSTDEPTQTATVASSTDNSSSSEVTSPFKSETPKSQRSASLILTSTPEKKPIFLKGGNNFTVRKPKERVVRRTPSVGAFSPENESSVYAFETEDREAPPTSTPFRRKTKDGGTNTSPNKQHHRHSSSSSESSSFVCSDVGSPGRKSASSDIVHSSKSVTPENSFCGGLDGHLDMVKSPTCTASIAIQVNLDESSSQTTKSPPISVPIYIPSSSREIGLSTSSSSPLVLLPETRSTECSTQTDGNEDNEKTDVDSIEASVSQKQPHTSEGHLFYIPLRPTSMVNQTPGIGSPSTSIAANQLIRGVAVKLGTEGPTGPNQRVIMHAELVTDPPPFGPTIQCQTGTLSTTSATFSTGLQEVKGTPFVSGTNRASVQHIHPTVVNLPPDQKHLCHPSILPISVVGPASQPLLTQQQSTTLSRPSVAPPVGTVQPTTRPRPLSSADVATGKSPALCVSSTQTENVKSDPNRSAPSTVSEQPKTVKILPKPKENVSIADRVSPGPSCSKASTSSTKRSQQKCKGRGAAAASHNESESSSSGGTSTSSVSLTNHPNPMATFPAKGSTARMVEAPTFHPTEKEFQDPLEFIERIRPIAEKFGLCRVVPPPNFKPDCQVSDDMRFTAYNQYVHKMLHRWGPNVKEMMLIKKYLRTQSISLTHPPWIGGMEVDLPRLYQTVQSFGGLKEVIEKKKWQRVADGMRIPKLAQDRVTKLDDIYCKYLLPYDTLSPDERQKLFDDIEKEWGDRENQPLNLEGQGNDDDSEGDASDEFDECIVKGRSMALNAFYRIARNTMATWFRQPEPSASDVETEYWRHVTTRTNHVCVHSGSIDSSVWGYGFPCTKGSPLARHPWNLKIFTNNSGSILRSMGPVMGVTVPTLHVGMLFTTCCWYRDPHGLPWVEYLHTGASKIWYGIPHSQSDTFRAAMTKLVPRYCKSKTIWLPSDTAMVPPTLLVKHGVSLCRTVQEPGQFILVFPRAFTSSICTGYLVSESVYFSQPGWLSTAEEVFKDIKDSCEPSMFSLERFLFRIATDTKSHVDVLKQVLPMIFRIRENELEKRKQLSALGLKSCERLPQQPAKRSRKGPRSAQDDDGDYECEVCRANLYVSLARIALEDKQKVTDSNEECVYCLQHAIELLTKKKNHVKYCKLLYTYDQNELNDMIQKLLERIETKTQKKSQSKHGAFSR